MKLYKIHIIIILAVFSWKAEAQLSPGELSRPHAQLEGISNCTQCHVLGEKVSNDKCLTCHKEIKSRITAKDGYHYSREVREKECADCHSEHHGRKFEMIRFEEKTFNHGLTGYNLTGAHQRVDCRQCHKPDYIADADLKKRQGTFLGLKEQCLTCHEDYHQKTLSTDCAKCHNTNEFAPAAKFNHDKTDFPLTGGHKTVGCAECHQKETRSGREFQKFAGIAFKNCNSCHSDPHNNQLGVNCKECHVEQSFTSNAGLPKFNHNKTHFPLKGRHQRIDCAQCHQMEASPLHIFQDRLGVKTAECATCHRDVHEGKFGANCADCHNETSFHKVGKMEGFDHSLTDFALKGKHQAVDCRKCHTSDNFLAPLPHNTCASCHADYHEGQFVRNAGSPDCAECHVVDGFAGSSFSIEQHGKTRFPLDGAHVATPCFACHLKENKWRFRNIGEQCVDCHKDVHQGTLNAQWYPNQACQSCHLTESWAGISKFDHSKTPFQLEKIHAQQKCSACHLRDEAHPYGKFLDLSQQCQSCHESVHGNQFEINGQTDCARCHGFDGWAIGNFDHSKTRFKLEGKHAETACDKCHRPSEVEDDIFVMYRLERFECADCHN